MLSFALLALFEESVQLIIMLLLFIAVVVGFAVATSVAAEYLVSQTDLPFIIVGSPCGQNQRSSQSKIWVFDSEVFQVLSRRVAAETKRGA